VSAKLGMVCLNDALLKLALNDTVECEEALSKAVDREDLRQKLIVAGVIQGEPLGKGGR